MTANRAQHRKISKSTLSMYLRTKCDRELYLSLHDKSQFTAIGLPLPVKRPGIGTLSIAGRDLELERNDQIVSLFGSSAIYSKGVEKFNNVDLDQVLSGHRPPPYIIIQPKYSVDAFKSQILNNIGVATADSVLIPPIADFIPDLLLIKSPTPDDEEVLIDGTRARILPTEQRLAISVFDIKHTNEANPSYCAEIAMYSLMLANWLAQNQSYKSRYYVSAKAFLWTLKKQGASAVESVSLVPNRSVDQCITALVTDSENAHLRYYLAAVRRFFEDVARVIRNADHSNDAWRDLDWHVVSSCSNCDWLGDKRHLGRVQHDVIDNDRSGYCLPSARDSGHLSLIPGITRGAKKTLQKESIHDAAILATSSGHPALQRHTMLKKEASILPVKTNAIINNTLSNDSNAVIASLAGYCNLQIFLSINFDASAGLLTGLAITGLVTTYTAGQPPTRFPTVPFVVDEKTLDAEWTALEGLLSHISDYIERAEKILGAQNLKGQIHIWENRQFTELCNAIGRHLPRVSNLSDRKARAMVWIFPPEELIGTPDAIGAATVVIIEDIIRRMVFTPTPHVVTLFDTAEVYCNLTHPPVVKDSYFREYLSNGIPRERIYEIWSNTQRIKRGPNTIPRNTLISEFADVLKKQALSVQVVCDKLRTDYRNSFKAIAPLIPTSIPQGARSVAFDAKLWIWWDNLNFETDQLESHFRSVLDGDRLEATYEAIILRNGRLKAGNVYIFDVEPTSAEAKFKDDSSFAVGKLGRPGFPLESAKKIIPSTAPPYWGDQTPINMPLWSVVEARLLELDRTNLKAIVEFTYWKDPSFISYLFTNSSVNFLDEIFLLESKKPKSFNWGITSKDILQEIGNPPVATLDVNAAAAMGISPNKRQARTGVDTPIAHLLWNAGSPYHSSRIQPAIATSIADLASQHGQLNVSQREAVKHAAEKGLTIIWGPPGTGKTKTLSALVHSIVQHASQANQTLKILITGPTYKAVEEIVERTHKLLAADNTSSCSIHFGYSSARTIGRLVPPAVANVAYNSFSFSNADPGYQNCQSALLSAGNTGVDIFCSQIRQARRFSKGANSFVNEVFDLIIIDESSQVPVSHSLSALCSQKSNARVVIAGDNLQMPPITSVEPPKEASYLVGSIQTYLTTRNFGTPIEPCVLNINYRSSASIVEFARSIGYPQNLQAYFPDTSLMALNAFPDQNQYPNHLPWSNQLAALLSPTDSVVALVHDDETSSQGNHYEARLVAGMIWMLRHTVSAELNGQNHANHRMPTPEEFWGNCVGVVTPHRAQRALVIKELEMLFPGEKNLINEAIDTVERFQGGERHCVIVTYGVADVDIIAGEESFLMQLERTNVAISRAMAKCIVVLPRSLAQHIPEDKNTLETAHALKDYLDYFCNIRVDCQFVDPSEVRNAQIRIHR